MGYPQDPRYLLKMMLTCVVIAPGVASSSFPVSTVISVLSVEVNLIKPVLTVPDPYQIAAVMASVSTMKPVPPSNALVPDSSAMEIVEPVLFERTNYRLRLPKPQPRRCRIAC